MDSPESQTASGVAQPALSRENQALVDRLLEEMRATWESGGSSRAEDYLRRHVELFAQSDAVAQLIFEEVWLRRQHGEDVTKEEIAQRFPQWPTELAVLVECHHALETPDVEPEYPEAGQTLGEFALVAELGRGGQGRVFLATQHSLADRPVVLKITPADGQEHLSLARLQHTHIVPLFWAQDFPERNLRVLCMPFLGVTTLARFLDPLAPCPLTQRSGKDIVQALDQSRLTVPVVLPPWGPERQVLEQSSYVEALCWIGACLADALHYAHQRGLVHLDLKPSNVLLGADSQPLILDFHLARTPVQPGEVDPEWLGGTPGYMSPEQVAAVEAVRRGRPVPAAVDARSDIYSLGLLLYEALGGSRENVEPRLLQRRNPAVSRGLADIVDKCLQTKPRARYATAALLAEDLRRHRDNQPLRGVPNRDLIERWRKWRLRKPHALPLIVAVLAFGIAVLAYRLAVYDSAAIQSAHFSNRRQAADKAFFNAKEQMQQGQYAEAIKSLLNGQDLLEGLPDSDDLAEALAGQLRSAQFAQKAQKLHQTVTFLRFFSLWECMSRRHLVVFDAACRNVWQARDQLGADIDVELRLQLKHDIQSDLADLAILWSDLRVRLASAAEAKAVAHQQALATLDEAEKRFGASSVLCREQSVHARALGRANLAGLLERRASSLPPKTAWEHYALGRFWLRHGDLEEADRQLQQAVDLDGHGFLAHFYQGVCAYRRNRCQDAVNAFTFCLGQFPMPECYFHRGLAYAALRQNDRALKDYNRALHNPQFTLAYLHRGILNRQLENYDAAARDLRQALDKGADPVLVHYQFALMQRARKDWNAARASLRQVLEHDPNHKEALNLLQRLPPN